MADVFEFIIDGTSGIAPGNIEGQAIITGLCSHGEVGKAYLLSLSSDIEGLLGIGTLTDACVDMLSQAGQDAVIIAVPVKAESSGNAIGIIEKSVESMPDISIESPATFPKAGAEIVLNITEAGTLNTAQYTLSLDNGFSFSSPKTLPVDGIIDLSAYGLKITFPKEDYIIGNYTSTIAAPTTNMENILEALENPLATYDVEFVYVALPTTPEDWRALDAKALQLWNMHKPTYFKTEARLPYKNEDLHTYVSAMLGQTKNFASHYVQVCVQYGSIINAFGRQRVANFCGLHAGKTMAIPVHRAAGRVRDGSIQGVKLPLGWDSVQPLLENAGYLTAKNYAGLKGAYFGDSRTMAEQNSDYKYEEVLRVVFKALRKLRLAALHSLYDDAGDPLLPQKGAGIAYLEAQLKNSLDTMVNAVPRELVAYNVHIPKNQDITNNGVAVEHTLIGVPVIRKIKLFASYVYAGSHLDPRLK